MRSENAGRPGAADVSVAQGACAADEAVSGCLCGGKAREKYDRFS